MPDLEKRIENSYQVQLISATEESGIRGNSADIKKVNWNKEGIAKLINSFDKLPSHFYLPAPDVYRVGLPLPHRDPEWTDELYEYFEKDFYETVLKSMQKDLGEDFYISYEEFEEAHNIGILEKDTGKVVPASFYLVEGLPDSDELKTVGVCNCNSNFPSNILLDNKTIDRYSDRDTLSLIVHELTHRISRNEDYQFITDLLGVPSDVNFEDFLAPNIEKLPKNVDSRTKLKHKYGTTNANEFISVASEFYIQGKEIFLKDYGMFIGQEKAEKLYDHMKDKIFRGKEYQGGKNAAPIANSIAALPTLPDGSLNYGAGVIGPSPGDIKKANLKK